MIPHLWIRIPQGILVNIVLSFIVFLSLIFGGVDEKTSNTKSSSKFQVLRCHSTHLASLLRSKVILILFPKAMGRILGLEMHI